MDPLPPQRRPRRSSERLLWAAMFLLGAGVTSALHTVDTRLAEGGGALRFASSAASRARVRSDGLLRRYLPAVARAFPLVEPLSEPALAPVLDSELAVR
jgi:hypothetical protein